MMMFLYKKMLRSAILVGFTVLLLAPMAVWSLKAQDATAEPIPVINITMTEYKFLVEGQTEDQPLQLETGSDYQLHFKNTGKLRHEVLIGSDPIIIEGGYKHDFNNLLLSDVETEISNGADEPPFLIGVSGLNEFELSPGQELTIYFVLPDDKVGMWEMACFTSIDPNAPEDNPGAGHYDIGMHLPVNVVAGSAPTS
jgi:uncharacterized cupredoxin-like copper-binding protein